MKKLIPPSSVWESKWAAGSFTSCWICTSLQDTTSQKRVRHMRAWQHCIAGAFYRFLPLLHTLQKGETYFYLFLLFSVCVCVCARVLIDLKQTTAHAFRQENKTYVYWYYISNVVKNPPAFFHTTTSFILCIFIVTFRNISNFPSISFVFIYDKQHNWCMTRDVVNFVYESGYAAARHLNKASHTEVENYFFWYSVIRPMYLPIALKNFCFPT
jgi:hypothetical protein